MDEEKSDHKKATETYLDWLSTYCELDEKGLKKKDEKMRKSAFAFLRGTFYRWRDEFREVNVAVQNVPVILCVGDAHLENFGTWRDHEGRLIWGVNDFDEATRLPFTSDLVRLATSARLAVHENSLTLPPDHAVDAVLEGYENHLRFGPLPFVLEDRHPWLRDLAVASGADAQAEWSGLIEKEIDATKVNDSARALLEKSLPTGISDVRFGRRRSGLGSLGRPKFVAVAELGGGLVARDVKAAAPSAVHVGQNIQDPLKEHTELEAKACRVRDPCLVLRDGWIVRRLSPESRKIELAAIEHISDLRHLLHAMGREIANVHIGAVGQRETLAQALEKLPSSWLRLASERTASLVQEEFEQFKET